MSEILAVSWTGDAAMALGTAINHPHDYLLDGFDASVLKRWVGTSDIQSIAVTNRGYPSPQAPIFESSSGGSTADAAVTADVYFGFTLSRVSPFKATRIKFKAARGGTGATRQFKLRSSIDGFTSDLLFEPQIPTARTTLTQYDVPIEHTAESIELRWYYGASNGGVSDFDDFELYVEDGESYAPENLSPPTLTIDSASFTGSVGSWDAMGAGPLTYEWELRDGTDAVIDSGTGTTISGTGSFDGYYYLWVQATNSVGSESAASSPVEAGEPEPAEGDFTAAFGLGSSLSGSIDAVGTIATEFALDQEFTGSKTTSADFVSAFALDSRFVGSAPAMPGEGAFVAELALSATIHTQRSSAGIAEFGFGTEPYFVGYHEPQASFAIGFNLDARFAGPVTIPAGTKQYAFATADGIYIFQTS